MLTAAALGIFSCSIIFDFRERGKETFSLQCACPLSRRVGRPAAFCCQAFDLRKYPP